MLNNLRVSAGLWHVLAAYLPHLTRAGFDSSVIEADTGVDRVRQNVWTVAQQVQLLTLPLLAECCIREWIWSGGALIYPVVRGAAQGKRNQALSGQETTAVVLAACCTFYQALPCHSDSCDDIACPLAAVQLFLSPLEAIK